MTFAQIKLLAKSAIAINVIFPDAEFTGECIRFQFLFPLFLGNGLETISLYKKAREPVGCKKANVVQRIAQN